MDIFELMVKIQEAFKDVRYEHRVIREGDKVRITFYPTIGLSSNLSDLVKLSEAAYKVHELEPNHDRIIFS